MVSDQHFCLKSALLELHVHSQVFLQDRALQMGAVVGYKARLGLRLMKQLRNLVECYRNFPKIVFLVYKIKKKRFWLHLVDLSVPNSDLHIFVMPEFVKVPGRGHDKSDNCLLDNGGSQHKNYINISDGKVILGCLLRHTCKLRILNRYLQFRRPQIAENIESIFIFNKEGKLGGK